uniref:T-complex protein 1 subunit beta n=1 Tax=Globodera rostochiensis TaxID=31243 RepID=A0A914HJC1_GLORO
MHEITIRCEPFTLQFKCEYDFVRKKGSDILSLYQNAQEERGETARLSSFVGACAIGDLVKTTLGPKGMDKILISGSGEHQNVQVTNDGATILKSIGVDNPAAKVLVDISLTQDKEVGDGTTSVTVFAAELLREAEVMVGQRIHPQVIVSGYRKAVRVAKDALEKVAQTSGEHLRDDLLKIAKTSLGSKILSQHSEHFAKLAVDAVLRLGPNGALDSIQGFLLEKKPGMYQPQRIEDAKILIANSSMDQDKIKVFGSRIRVDSVAKIAELEQAEKDKMKQKVEKICSHDINVFINRQLIYNYPEQLFADRKVMAIEHADFEGIERLALVLGGEIASTFDNPSEVKLGSCKLIEETTIGEDTLLRFSGVPLGNACSVVLRGSTQQIIDEAERSLHDALCVLSTHVKDQRVVPGAGASEMLMATAVLAESQKVAGKESIAMEAFARALTKLPTIICDNAGLDSAEIISHVRAEHSKGNRQFGIDVENGRMGDVFELGVLESYNVKLGVLCSGAEAAEQLLRVDCIIKCAPRPRTKDRRPPLIRALLLQSRHAIMATLLMRVLGLAVVFPVFLSVFLYLFVPALFFFCPIIMQHVFFLNFVRVPFVDYYDLAHHGVRSRGRNFYLRERDLKTQKSTVNVGNDEPTIGVWHILPTSLSAEKGTKMNDKDMERSLNEGSNAILIYLHGNSFDRTTRHRCELYNFLSSMDFHILAVDYRGYGDSTGRPDENGVNADAHAIYDYARKKASSKDIYVWGHSMGTGVATRLVAELSDLGTPPKALVLESPFNNLRDVVRHHPFSFPWRVLPWFDATIVRPLVRSGLRMNSDDRIQSVSCPILVLHAEDDHVIPVKLARKLVDSAKTAKREVTYMEFDAKLEYRHKFIHRAPELPEVLREFFANGHLQQRSKNRIQRENEAVHVEL